MTAFWVAAGAAIGAPMRFLVTNWLRSRWGTAPAAGTLAVNVLGSFVLGLLAGAAVSGSWWALLGIGLCGALTTFSTLALELQDAVTDGRARHAVAGVLLHLLLGVGAAWLGWALTAA